MASAEHEPITGVWSRAPSGSRGRAPIPDHWLWASWTLKAF